MLGVCVLSAGAVAMSAAHKSGDGMIVGGFTTITSGIYSNDYVIGVHTQSDGSDRGRLTHHSRSLNFFQECDIDAMYVDGNEAWVSGTIVDSSDVSRIGRQCGMHLIDNGAGANASGPDSHSYINVGGVNDPAWRTLMKTIASHFDVAHGNFLIRG